MEREPSYRYEGLKLYAPPPALGSRRNLHESIGIPGDARGYGAREDPYRGPRRPLSLQNLQEFLRIRGDSWEILGQGGTVRWGGTTIGVDGFWITSSTVSY